MTTLFNTIAFEDMRKAVEEEIDRVAAQVEQATYQINGLTNHVYFCEKCGNPIVYGDNFCEQCGHNVTEQLNRAAHTPNTLTTYRNEKMQAQQVKNQLNILKLHNQVEKMKEKEEKKVEEKQRALLKADLARLDLEHYEPIREELEQRKERIENDLMMYRQAFGSKHLAQLEKELSVINNKIYQIDKKLFKAGYELERYAI